MYDLGEKYGSIHPTAEESSDDFYNGGGINVESYNKSSNDDNVASFDRGDRFDRNEYRPTNTNIEYEDEREVASSFTSSQSQSSPFESSTGTSFDTGLSSKSETGVQSSPFKTLTKKSDERKPPLPSSSNPIGSSSGGSFNNVGLPASSSSSTAEASQSQPFPKSNPTSIGSSPFGSSTTPSVESSILSPFSASTQNTDEEKPTSSSPFGSFSGSTSINNVGSSPSSASPLPKSTPISTGSSPFGSSSSVGSS